jgi:hypothetical protein
VEGSMNTIEKTYVFILVAILFWAGFGSFLWGLVVGILTIVILTVDEIIIRSRRGYLRK